MDSNISILPLGDWGIFSGKQPCVIAGPCSAESEEQVMRTAAALKEAGVELFRAGIWKPRTHPGCFEGVGEAGLAWLGKVRSGLGMKVCTEVAGAKHVAAALEAGVDVLWVGARTTPNPFLMEEIGCALEGADVPVLVKNPVNPDLELWIGAIERLNRHGVKKLGVVHRGFSTSAKISYRNDPDWETAIAMRSRHPELPFFCDPSHMGGSREYVPEIAQKAMDLGLDGLMVESHCDPSCALSDAGQQLSPEDLSRMLASLKLRSADSESSGYRESIGALRARMDVVDDALVELLSTRMGISREIGRIKKENNIAILQTGRWEEVLRHVGTAAAGKGLDQDFIREIFEGIHNESVREQDIIIENK